MLFYISLVHFIFINVSHSILWIYYNLSICAAINNLVHVFRYTHAKISLMSFSNNRIVTGYAYLLDNAKLFQMVVCDIFSHYAFIFHFLDCWWGQVYFHVFMAIWISSFLKYLFKSFVHFFLLVFLLLCKFFVFNIVWLLVLCQLYMLQISSPTLWHVFILHSVF